MTSTSNSHRHSQSSIASSDTSSEGRSSTMATSRMEVNVRLNGQENRRRLRMQDSVDYDVSTRSDVTRKDLTSEDYKVEIVRRLIENFDLEKTVERYRNLSTVEYKIQPKDFSLDSSLHANRVSSQIRDLMGSDVILLLNKNYREELDKRLAKQQEAKLKQEEKKRAEKESQRLRRLLADGVITAEKFQREMGQQRDHHCNHNTRCLPLAKHKMAEDKHFHHEVSPRASGPSSLRPGYKQIRCLSSKSHKQHNPREAFTDRDSELEWTPIRSEEEHKTYRAKKPQRPKNELVDLLYKEETVEGLYKIARRIVEPGHKETESDSNITSPKPTSTYYVAQS